MDRRHARTPMPPAPRTWPIYSKQELASPAPLDAGLRPSRLSDGGGSGNWLELRHDGARAGQAAACRVPGHRRSMRGIPAGGSMAAAITSASIRPTPPDGGPGRQRRRSPAELCALAVAPDRKQRIGAARERVSLTVCAPQPPALLPALLLAPPLAPGFLEHADVLQHGLVRNRLPQVLEIIMFCRQGQPHPSMPLITMHPAYSV